MTTLQRQARALGDPTRHDIFQYIANRSADVDVPELTAHFSLNHNAIRQHLAKLLDARLIEEDKARRTSPGRPRLVYRIAPNAESRWGAVGPYERLSRLLAEIIRTGKTPEEVGRDLGRKVAVAPSPSSDTVADVAAAMERQGFEPVVEARRTGTEIVLTTCPFASTALADRTTVCSLHLGFAEGLTEDTDVEIHQLVARDPRKAQCRLRVQEKSGQPAPAPAELVLVGTPRTARNR